MKNFSRGGGGGEYFLDFFIQIFMCVSTFADEKNIVFRVYADSSASWLSKLNKFVQIFFTYRCPLTSTVSV